jgi:hypothetical protein
MQQIEGLSRIGSNDAGLLDGVIHSGLLRDGLQLRSCMPEIEVME